MTLKTQFELKMILTAIVVLLMVAPGLAQEEVALESTATTADSFIWHKATVDSSGDRGTYTSIAFHPTSDTPWISYYDKQNEDLMVAHRVGSGGNCGPGNGWYCEVVDAYSDSGRYSSIDVYLKPSVIGSLRVGVTYWSPADGALRFAEYSCSPIHPFSCSWSVDTIMYSGPAARMDTSLKYGSNGKPHVAFYDDFPDGADTLSYAKRESGGWSTEDVDTGEGVGQFASLDLDASGNPYIAYYDATNRDLKYAYRIGGSSGNCGTGNNWNCSIVDGVGLNVGESASLVRSANGSRLIAYYDATNQKLKYARSVPIGGNCGGGFFECQTIGDAAFPNGNRSISLAVDNNDNPLIAYRYSSGQVSQLRVAQPIWALGLLNGNCGPKYGTLYTWQCLTIDSESSLLGSIAEHISVAFDPNDLPMIAYEEYGFKPLIVSSDTDLKIAYRRFGLFLPLVLRNSP